MPSARAREPQARPQRVLISVYSASIETAAKRIGMHGATGGKAGIRSPSERPSGLRVEFSNAA